MAIFSTLKTILNPDTTASIQSDKSNAYCEDYSEDY